MALKNFVKYMALFLCLFSVQVCAANLLKVSYLPAQTAQERQALMWLKNSKALQASLSILEERFVLGENLEIIFGAEEDPVYDPARQEILISYAFVSEVAEYFVASNYEAQGYSIEQAAMDAVIHTVYHEFAHAFINQHEIPILAREEDAADSFANVFLIELMANGRDIVESAADLFYFESPDLKELEPADFWGEHSLSIQRFYQGQCHLYGSDPDRYQAVMKDLGVSKQRQELCVEEWGLVVEAWFFSTESFRKDS